LAGSSTDLSDVVFIIDTIKKFVDMLDKRVAKEFLRLLRTLTVKGATVCCLGHTNKYADVNGLTVFEGTVDFRNDVDELIYLDALKNELTNVVEVTTRPDKVRAEFSPRSFKIHLNEDRRVESLDSIIPVRSKEASEMIKALKSALADGNTTQGEIISHACMSGNFGRDKITKLLRTMSAKGDVFVCEKVPGKNAYTYKLADEFEADFLAALI
jgi:hypothetical protein